jgi:hypothetical protein
MNLGKHGCHGGCNLLRHERRDGVAHLCLHGCPSTYELKAIGKGEQAT